MRQQRQRCGCSDLHEDAYEDGLIASPKYQTPTVMQNACSPEFQIPKSAPKTTFERAETKVNYSFDPLNRRGVTCTTLEN